MGFGGNCVFDRDQTLKGEEICENYGPIFFHSAKDDRQSRLEKQYWFKCQCIACQENWPLMHEMTQDVLNFRFRGRVKVLRETKLLNLQMWRVRWLRSLPHQLEHASAEVDLKLCQQSTTSLAKPLKCCMCNLSTSKRPKILFIHSPSIHLSFEESNTP